MSKKIFLFLIVGLLLIPVSVSAQWGAAKTNLATVGGKTGLEANLETSVGTIIAGALALVGTIFLILTVYAGILWMTAQGNEERVTKAKNIITAAIIGLVITMAAYAITSFVTGRLSGGGGGGGGTLSDGGSDAGEAADCSKLGGTCIASTANGGQPCDPDGVDDYTGNTLGLCADTTQTCCELKDSAGGGKLKCSNMGGTCMKLNCPSGTEDVGDCDEPGADLTNNCCRPL